MRKVTKALGAAGSISGGRVDGRVLLAEAGSRQKERSWDMKGVAGGTGPEKAEPKEEAGAPV